VFWWYERSGAFTRCEVLQLPTGEFEIRVVYPDGHEQVERFTSADELAARQTSLEAALRSDGWSGRHGWVL
jgi:hypothetical protein